MGAEKRECKRMFFSKDDGPIAIFTFVDTPEKSITTIVMDLSMGGLGLSIRKDQSSVNVGDRMLLSEIRGAKGLDIADVEMEVRWLHNYEKLTHILFGCEFADPSESLRIQIQEFINSRIEDQILRIED